LTSTVSTDASLETAAVIALTQWSQLMSGTFRLMVTAPPFCIRPFQLARRFQR
jgi:hypothetical protein